jgi:HD-like signal output (HDOD) protein
LGELPPLLRHWHSSRAVLTACTAAAFAEGMEKVSEESAYLLGLTQDVGILVMARALGERYTECLDRVRRVAHLNLAHVEQDCYHVSHAEVSAALLRKWVLPGSLVSLVLRHHDRDLRDSSNTDQRFLRAMQIGEAFSDLHDNRAAQRYLKLRSRITVPTVRPPAAIACCAP